MDIQVQKNRENLFNSLISQGFFVDDNGEPEMTLAEFGEQVDDEENTISLYENLVDAEVLVDTNGNPLMSQDDFLLQILGLLVKRVLLEKLLASGKPVVTVLMNGRPLALGWEAEHLPAILEAWQGRECPSICQNAFRHEGW